MGHEITRTNTPNKEATHMMSTPAIDEAHEAALLTFDQAVVASYRNHADAESAVRLLSDNGVPINHISIVGRSFETYEHVQGFYRPADAAFDGAWAGGIFGLMLGAIGFFILPVAGPLMVIGPLAGMIAAAVAGAGAGALINGLVAAGIPKADAQNYQQRLQSGEFLVVVHANAKAAARAHDILHGTAPIHLQTHSTSTKGSAADCKVGMLM